MDQKKSVHLLLVNVVCKKKNKYDKTSISVNYK